MNSSWRIAAFSLASQMRPAIRAPYIMVIVMSAALAILSPNLISFDTVNLTFIESLALILVAAGQTVVILTGGIDLSVGGVVSLTTVLAVTHMQREPLATAALLIVLVGAGMGIGALNGLIIVKTGIQPFIVTLSTWSVGAGFALLILPTPGGHVPQPWIDAATASVAGLSIAVIAVFAIGFWWLFFTRTRTGMSIKAIGSDRKAASLIGVNVAISTVLAYAISGLFAALAGLALVAQEASGSPIIGSDFILPSVTAVVIGGARLTGGKASIGGTIAGALVLTLVNDIAFALGLTRGWNVLVIGVLLVFSVIANDLRRLQRLIPIR